MPVLFAFVLSIQNGPTSKLPGRPAAIPKPCPVQGNTGRFEKPSTGLWRWNWLQCVGDSFGQKFSPTSHPALLPPGRTGQRHVVYSVAGPWQRGREVIARANLAARQCSEVHVLEHGFACAGQVYPTLSAVAKAIIVCAGDDLDETRTQRGQRGFEDVRAACPRGRPRRGIWERR